MNANRSSAKSTFVRSMGLVVLFAGIVGAVQWKESASASVLEAEDEAIAMESEYLPMEYAFRGIDFDDFVPAGSFK